MLGLEPYEAIPGLYLQTGGSSVRIAADQNPSFYELREPKTTVQLRRSENTLYLHFYLGDPVEVLQISSWGKPSVITMGQSERLHLEIPPNVWHGVRLRAGGQWGLLGVGNEFRDTIGFNFASYDDLAQDFPKTAGAIKGFSLGELH